MTEKSAADRFEDRVGVVIPVFDTGELALGAARSAQRALGGTANVIVVDDGSTDRATRQVLSSLADEGFRVIRQPNAGVSAARNAGIAQLSTPYVVALDSDDELLPEAARRMADELEASPSTAIVTGGGFEVDGDAETEFGGPEQIVTRTTMRHECLILAASMFRRGDWEAVGGYPEGVAVGEDWVFWMRLLRQDGAVTDIGHPIVRRHVGPHQVTRGYIDPRAGARARDLVRRENPEVVEQHLPELVEQLSEAERMLAEYRHAYRHIDRVKRTARGLLRR